MLQTSQSPRRWTVLFALAALAVSGLAQERFCPHCWCVMTKAAGGSYVRSDGTPTDLCQWNCPTCHRAAGTLHDGF